MLKPKGILGIVLPDGILSNMSLDYVREYIRQNAIIKAVISLPVETFQPYGSGVKGSLLFIQKKDIEGKLEQDNVFMAIAENIGYDATGRATGKEELRIILKDYKKTIKGYD